MRSTICAIARAAANLTASGQSALMPKAPGMDTAVRMGPRLDGPRHDSTELALIAQLIALYSDSATRAMFDKSLSNPSVVGMQTPNPDAQAIVDRFLHIGGHIGTRSLRRGRSRRILLCFSTPRWCLSTRYQMPWRSLRSVAALTSSRMK